MRVHGEDVLFMSMKKVTEYVFLWTLGGSIYYFLECIFRGFSHWSMFILGGICLCFLWFQGSSVGWEDAMWIQVIRSTVFVVACEFITGIIVNKWMRWQVWDYSDQPYNVFGQICLPFAVLFSGLSVIGITLSGFLMHKLFLEEKPNYHIL